MMPHFLQIIFHVYFYAVKIHLCYQALYESKVFFEIVFIWFSS